MNLEKVRRAGTMAVIATFALIVLAACGEQAGLEAEPEDVTRVPTMSDAAAQATREAPPPGASPEAEATPVEGEAAPAPEGESAEGVTVEVVSHDIFFEPNEITIPANTDVTVSLPNEGAAPHNFSIDELGIDVDLAPGATEQVVINAPAGTYEYYCNVPGHKEAGMVGTLIVSEEAGAVPAAAEETVATPATAEAASPAAEEADAEAAPAAAAEPVTVVAHDIFFDPDEVTVPADTDVTFALPNEGAAPHNFSIDELGIDVDILPGETQEVVINAPAGEYEFYCNVPGHKEAGMAGTLIVSAEAAAPADTGAAAGAVEASPAAAAVEQETVAEATPEATAGAAVAAEPVTVVSHDIFFEPDEVTIPANTDVTFVLPNEGVTLHNFAIDALGISVDQAPGETYETVINAPPGEYEFYCNVPGHKEAGMVGTLIVTDDAGAAPTEEGATAAQEAAPAASPAQASPETDETSPAAAEESAPTAAEPVEVVSHDIFFEPDEITIPADSDVTFKLPNQGAAPHNLSIDELGIDVDQAPGATEQVVVNAPAGTYEFYCNVPGHREAGMVGTLTVE